MGFAHNNVLHSNHFRKDWQRRVRTWFDQPGRKLRRRNARKTKAAALGVRPLTLLRPAVRAQTVRYNRKVREGRGFTLAELKEVGINRKEARGVGIVVDHRRRNLSEEGKKLNVERLKAYKAKLIVFPRMLRSPRRVTRLVPISRLRSHARTFPFLHLTVHEAPRKITDDERSFEAFKTLRVARADARYEGVRKIRAAKKEEEEANKKK
ncbi:60S ribosomal protein L13 [Suillus occidentalis]|nr:60S ribosomal protein L13 [Suillus occidentalis]